MNLVTLLKEANDSGGLMKMLQSVQKNYGYITSEAIDLIESEFDVPRSKIYGVATFYSQFRLSQAGKYIIKVCRGTACHVIGSMQLVEDLKELLNIQDGEDTTSDKLFTIEEVACLGCCSLAPAIMIGEEVYGKVKKEKLNEILGRYK